jgi:hypothetical protein
VVVALVGAETGIQAVADRVAVVVGNRLVVAAVEIADRVVVVDNTEAVEAYSTVDHCYQGDIVVT